MELPEAIPATAEEYAAMLQTQRVVEHRRRHPGSVEQRVHGLRAEEEVTARQSEAQTLEAFHTEPLPPGYFVIFAVDAQGRTIYSLRVPPADDDESRMVAEDIRVVLAEAWNRYYTRLPDGLDREGLERLVREPPEPQTHLWRTFWEMGLHHAAYCEVSHALNLIVHMRATPEREAAIAMLGGLHVASGSMEARRMGRLAHLLGLWDDEDPDRASLMFLDDPQVILPWVSLLGRYLNRVDPGAGRWWVQYSAKLAILPNSAEDAERRMAFATRKAWAATYLMTMACAAEFARDAPQPPELAEQALNEGIHTGGRIEALGLLPRDGMDYDDVTLWAKRVLHKSAPRLLKILARQFPCLGSKTQSMID